MRILEIENLKKSYTTPDGEILTVIDVPGFALESGEQIALSGESGSGKTTFLNLVAGILRPDGGRIILGGEDVTALSEAGRDRLRADKIGYIFQTFNLLQGYTALENVLLGMMFGKGADKGFALVLADEPTGNLDPGTAGKAVSLIKEMCAENGAALLLVSHDDKVLGNFGGVKDLGEINRASRGGIEK